MNKEKRNLEEKRGNKKEKKKIDKETKRWTSFFLRSAPNQLSVCRVFANTIWVWIRSVFGKHHGSSVWVWQILKVSGNAQ